MKTTAANPSSTTSLRRLAAKANHWHCKAEHGVRITLSAAKRSGEALNAAHAKVKRGQWQRWVEANFDASYETAAIYRSIASNWSVVQPYMAEDQTLSIDKVRKLFAELNRLRRDEEDADRKPPRGYFNRKQLLKQLESVSCGLSEREIIDQSASFVFKGGKVFTFNDEVACELPCALPVEGAIPARPLLGMLRQLKDAHIKIRTIEEDEHKLVIEGDQSSISFSMEQEITLPLDQVDEPDQWRPLPENLIEALQLVENCAYPDDSVFNMSCIHFHPRFIEACDNYQAARYKIRTGVDTSVLIRRGSIKQVLPLGVTEVCETESWMHFRNPLGLIISCRKYIDDYPDLKGLLDVKRGERLSLAAGIRGATMRAKVFTSEHKDEENKRVRVRLESGKMQIEAQGVNGSFEERKKIRYNGKRVDFSINPVLLQQIAQIKGDWRITPTNDRIWMRRGAHTHVVVLLPLD